jgi:hypothetical protein
MRNQKNRKSTNYYSGRKPIWELLILLQDTQTVFYRLLELRLHEGARVVRGACRHGIDVGPTPVAHQLEASVGFAPIRVMRSPFRYRLFVAKPQQLHVNLREYSSLQNLSPKFNTQCKLAWGYMKVKWRRKQEGRKTASCAIEQQLIIPRGAC